MEATYVLKAILRTVQSYPLAPLPIGRLEGETLASFLSPFFRPPHPPDSLGSRRSAVPAPRSLWAGVRGLCRGVRPAQQPAAHPQQGWDLRPGNGGLQQPSVTDLCPCLSTRSCKKREPGKGHARRPLSAGAPCLRGRRGAEPLPTGGQGGHRPSPRGHGPAFTSEGSIVAPDFSSNCFCQAEQPRESLKREAAGPKLEKLLLGTVGFGEGWVQPMQRPPSCPGTSQLPKRDEGCAVGRHRSQHDRYRYMGIREPTHITRRVCIWKV